MNFSIEGDDPRSSIHQVLRLSTPSQRERPEDIDNFFRNCTSTLTRLFVTTLRIFCISIMLQEPQELGPTSYYLEALCAFLRENDLKLAEDRTEDCPLRLEIYVSDEDGDNQNRSNLFITEATSRICRSFWENERARTAEFVFLDLCVIPSLSVVELWRFGRNSNNSSPSNSGLNSNISSPQNPSPTVTIQVVDHVNSELDLLIVDVPKMRFTGSASLQVAGVVDFMLGSFAPDLGTCLRASFHSCQAAATLTASLVRNKHHGFSDIVLNNAMQNSSESDVTSETPALLEAVLRCPSVTDLRLSGFYFTATDVTNLREAFSEVGPASVLTTLAFSECMILDPDHGFSSLATTMTPSCSLCQFFLNECFMQENDMTNLCSILARSEWPLATLSFQDQSLYYNPMYLNDVSVVHFFQMLPSMKTMKRLHFHRIVSQHLSRIVLDGIKNNYTLHDVTGLEFHTTRLNDEMNLYTSANAKGRTAIYEALTNLSNQEYRQINEEAITVLHRLSNSSNQKDESILFLCVQLFLSH
jgi:hypothetical protein